MKPDKSFPGKGCTWVPPTITKLPVATETKSTARVGTIKNTELPLPATPGSKFGLALEWSFPLSARTD